jgi:hypothetical protein
MAIESNAPDFTNCERFHPTGVQGVLSGTAIIFFTYVGEGQVLTYTCNRPTQTPSVPEIAARGTITETMVRGKTGTRISGIRQ